MNILVVGSGAREDAICKSLKRNEYNNVFCAPGNSGMKLFGIQIVELDELDFEGLAQFASKNDIEFTIVGPEQPLVLGIVDYFESKNLKIFGPSKISAQIEGSKSFAKELMKSAGVATAAYEEFSDFESAYNYLSKVSFPIVIKANGLASGKGVYIVPDLIKGRQILQNLLLDHQYKTEKVVIEEFFEGEEFSLMSFVTGNKFYPMPIAQDYKRAFDRDQGPNTGGMGAVCPVNNISQLTIDNAYEEIVGPFVNEMERQQVDYIGILYAGLILTKDGVKVIEFNVRFGDPETEVVIPRLDSDLSQLIYDLVNKKDPKKINWKIDGIDLGVFVASKGYPEKPQINNVIGFKEQFLKHNIEINFAGIKELDDAIISDGGRLYCVHSHSDNLSAAKKDIYNFLYEMDTTNVFYRSDIGNNSKRDL